MSVEPSWPKVSPYRRSVQSLPMWTEHQYKVSPYRRSVQSLPCSEHYIRGAYIVNYYDRLCLTTRHTTLYAMGCEHTGCKFCMGGICNWVDLQCLCLVNFLKRFFILYKPCVLTNYFHSWPVFSHAFQVTVSKFFFKVYA
jgi:hypothetical protein